MSEVKHTAIIVAAGSGERMGSKIPKQFLPLQGKPILIHTLEQLAPHFDQIIVVLSPFGREHLEQLKEEYPLPEHIEIALGGGTRFESVANALKIARADQLIAVHDGVRPFISAALIERLLRAAAVSGAALPALPLQESLRCLQADGSSRSVDRSLYYTVQTPQVFSATTLKESYQLPYQESFTDDASVYEAYTHQSPQLIEGERNNIKITTPLDLLLSEQILLSKQ